MPSHTGESNLRQRRAGPTLQQLSYVLTPMLTWKHKKKEIFFFFFLTGLKRGMVFHQGLHCAVQTPVTENCTKTCVLTSSAWVLPRVHNAILPSECTMTYALQSTVHVDAWFTIQQFVYCLFTRMQFIIQVPGACIFPLFPQEVDFFFSPLQKQLNSSPTPFLVTILLLCLLHVSILLAQLQLIRVPSLRYSPGQHRQQQH